MQNNHFVEGIESSQNQNFETICLQQYNMHIHMLCVYQWGGGRGVFTDKLTRRGFCTNVHVQNVHVC